jgi:hypothetical protein
MARLLRRAAICPKRSGADWSFSSLLCAIFTSLSRVRNELRFMVFIHVAPLTLRQGNATDYPTVPAVEDSGLPLATA